MKRILMTSALIVATAAGAASAMPTGNELTFGERQVVQSYLPNAELTNLSVAQVGAIESAIIQRDADSASSVDFGTKVQKILNWN